MRPITCAIACLCWAGVVVVGMMGLSTGSRGAEALRVEGGQIADVTPANSGVRLFRGIPYAAPPVGELRWRKPEPVNAWVGIRKTLEWGPRCVQSNRLGDIDPLNKRMDEDCLYLNVWTSARSPRRA